MPSAVQFANAEPLIVVTLPKSTLPNVLTPLNAETPIVFKVLGATNSVSFVAPNANKPIDSKPSLNTTSVNAVQPRNASESILLIVAGKVTFVILRLV